MPVTLQDVQAAREKLVGRTLITPVLRAYELEAHLNGAEIYLKLENLQLTGSFKLRGATCKLLSLTEAERARGVITASSGNHAQAVAFAATRLGIKATVVMPVDAPSVKLARTKAFGATVIQHGTTGTERDAKAHEIAKDTGALFVSSHADAHLIAGQGTAALELMDQVPDLDEIVCPLGAGGLTAGVLAAADGKIKVTPVEPAGVPRFTESLKAGRPLTVPMGQTLGDGLRVDKADQINYDVIVKHKPAIVLQDDTHILELVGLMVRLQKVVAEPSSVLPLAAAMAGKIDTAVGRKVGFIISGGNIDPGFLADVLAAK